MFRQFGSLKQSHIPFGAKVFVLKSQIGEGDQEATIGSFTSGSKLIKKEKSIDINNFFIKNPGVEEKIAVKNEEFIKKGGKFLSFCPVSKYSVYVQ